MYDGYLNLGGTEVLNQARAYELMTVQSCPAGWIRCMPCPGLEDADGATAAEYGDVRNAPWYDAEIEATHRFLGFYPVEVDGLTASTRTADIQEGILDGGVVQGSRRAVREVRVRGLMVGQGMDALEEGVSWLDSVLDGAECSTHQGSCGEVDACFYSACPPERPMVTDYTPWTRSTENLATNPSFETTSGTVVVRENLATNPSFETASGTVEVRRNLHPNPSVEAAVVSNNWHVGNNGTGSTSTGTRVAAIGYDGGYGWRKEWTAADTAANTSPTINMLGTSSGDALAASPSTAYTASVWVRPSIAETMSLTFVEHDAAGAVSVAGGTRVNVAAGEWARLSVTVTTKSTTVKIRFSIATHSSIIRAVGTQWDADMFLLEQSSTLGPYFDGATQPAIRENLVPNPAPTTVTGWNTPSAVITADGIQGTFPTPTTAYMFSDRASSAFAVGDLITLAIDYRVDVLGGNPITHMVLAPHKRTGNVYYKDKQVVVPITVGRWERVVIPWTVTEAIPINELDMTVVSSNASGVFTTAGAGFQITARRVIIERGTTDGSYFDGATPAVGNTAYAWRGAANASASYSYDSDLSTYWEGTANASAGRLMGKVVTPATSNQAVSIQSTAWSSNRSKSVRTIPNGVGGNNVSVTYPYGTGNTLGLQVGKTYTAMVKLRLAAPLTGTLHANSRKLVCQSLVNGTYEFYPSDPAPNVAGVHDLRVTFTIKTGATNSFLYLCNGASAGNGDAWWDDLLIVEGTYTGPYFDGYSDGAIRQNLQAYPAKRGSQDGAYVSVGGTATHTDGSITRTVDGVTYPTNRITCTDSVTARIGLNKFYGTATAGRTTTVAFDVYMPADQDWGNNTGTWIFRDTPNNDSSAAVKVSSLDTFVPGQWSRVWVTYTPNAGRTITNVYFTPTKDPVAGDWWEWTRYSEGLAPDAYFDGSTLPANGETFAWRGTPGASASYSYDADLTYGWSGTPDASTSQITGVKVAELQPSSQMTPTSAYSTADSPANRTRAARFIVGTTSSTGIPVANVGTATVTGTVYTLKFKVRPSRDMNIQPRIRAAVAPAVLCPAGVWTQLSVTIAAGSGSAAQTGGLLGPGAGHQVGDTIDIDEVLIVAGEYGGNYFDGTTPNEELERGQWTGTPDASTSVIENRTPFEAPVSDEEYDELLFPLRRRLHGVVAISGPLITEQFHRRGFYGYLVEFTLAATTPYVFGEQKPLELAPVVPTVVQDKPFNLVPYPSAEIATAADVIVASNYSTNPSVEVNATGWSVVADGTKIIGANVAGARSTELFSIGTASYKATWTAPAAGSTEGWFGSQQEVTVPVGMSVSFNMWSAGSVQSGTAALGPIEIVAYWRLAGATVRTDILGSFTESGVVSVRSVVPPAGATSVIVRSMQKVTSWSAGAVVRLYADALAVTVP